MVNFDHLVFISWMCISFIIEAFWINRNNWIQRWWSL